MSVNDFIHIFVSVYFHVSFCPPYIVSIVLLVYHIFAEHAVTVWNIIRPIFTVEPFSGYKFATMNHFRSIFVVVVVVDVREEDTTL